MVNCSARCYRVYSLIASRQILSTIVAPARPVRRLFAELSDFARINEVPRTADKSTLLKRTLPTRIGLCTTPCPRSSRHSRISVCRSAHHQSRPARFHADFRPGMHTGGDLQRTSRKMVLGKQLSPDSLVSNVPLSRVALPPDTTARYQPHANNHPAM